MNRTEKETHIAEIAKTFSGATSVYLAPGGADYLVEVYDPSPRRARSLALGGSVRQVP